MSTVREKSFGGPGAIVAAAFIGPGTITVCTIAGAKYQFVLLWAMLISLLATIILQNMAARLGVVTRKDIPQLVRQHISSPLLKWVLLILILSSIVIGNAAYEAGNLMGGALGLSGLIPVIYPKMSAVLLGLIAMLLLYLGRYPLFEKFMMALVLIMSLSFLITAIYTSPSLTAMVEGLFIPRIPEGSLLVVLSLIGTTIVPYNIFMHSALSKEKWQNAEDAKAAQKDTIRSVSIGGIVSLSIIVASAAIPSTTEIAGAASLAQSLQPLYGELAFYLISLGLLAAGVSSAITAPLAAAYVFVNCFGWKTDLKGLAFRRVWILIVLVGMFGASLGYKPVEIIQFAQIANGLMLPIAGLLLIWLTSKSSVMGTYRNGKTQILMGTVIIFVILLLGIKSIWSVING